MLSPELEKIKKQLEAGERNLIIDSNKLLSELKELESECGVLHESLSLSENVCPTCGRRF